jgi:hypothetical protein
MIFTHCRVCSYCVEASGFFMYALCLSFVEFNKECRMYLFDVEARSYPPVSTKKT